MSSVCPQAVTANSEKIAVEEIKCQALADNAQKDLEEALPALEEAMRVLGTGTRMDGREIGAGFREGSEACLPYPQSPWG